MDRRDRIGRIRLKRGNFTLEDRAATVILVAQVNIDCVDTNSPGRNERAFQKTMRIAFQVVAVLERARLAFVDVDRHQTRRGFGRYQFPFAAGGETGTTQAAQAGVFHRRDHVGGLLCSGDAGRRERISAGGAIRRVIDAAGSNGTCTGVSYVTGLNRLLHLLGGCVRNRILADDCNRRGFAAAHTRSMQHAHTSAEQRGQFREQIMRTCEIASDRIADADRNRRRRSIALFDHVKVVIERRHFVDFRHRHLHLGRQRDQMAGRKAAVTVLDLVQMLDQQIPAARRIA
jgi:hypothetical protein